MSTSGRVTARACARVARGGPAGRLTSLERRILSQHQGSVRCAVLNADCGGVLDPVLSVSPLRAPRYLLDQPCARISCRLSGDNDLSVALRAYNGRVLAGDLESASEQDVLRLVDDMLEIAAKMAPCEGFAEQGPRGEVFARVRKVDFGAILVEEARGGGVAFRARACKVLFDPHENEESSDLDLPERSRICPECLHLLKDLDRKYCSGRNTAGKEEQEEQEEQQREEQPQRSSRKVVKNKRLFGGDFDFVHPKDENDENSPQNKIKEELTVEEEVLGGGDNDDEDFELRRSSRKRKSTNRSMSYSGGVKRKRGRPPIVLSSPVKCKDCGESFVVAKDYKLHCLSHTNNFPCDRPGCHKRFRTQEDLDVHARRHRGERPFQCSDCEEGFSTKSELRTHQQKHTGMKPFPCPSCPKSFARAQQRDIHLAVHTGERPHLCAECGRSFASASTLIDHRKRKHLELREHRCPDCPKAFFARMDLESHRRTHTGDKPFQCKHCGKAFNRTHHLKRHVQSMHQGQKASIGPKKEEEAPIGHVILEGNLLKLAEGLKKGALLVTEEDGGEEESATTTVILDDETEYELDGQRYTTSIASDGTAVLVPKMEEVAVAEGQQRLHISTISGDAASSLIELSQVRVEGSDATSKVEGASSSSASQEQDTVVVEISEDAAGGDGGGGNFIVVTTGVGESDASLVTHERGMGRKAFSNRKGGEGKRRRT